METQEEYRGWLAESMKNLEIADEEVYVDYLCGMLEDGDDDDAVESITELLSELTTKDVGGFASEARTNWLAMKENAKKREEEEKARKAEEKKKRLEEERKRQDEAIAAKEAAETKSLSKEEQKERNALIERYGIDLEDSKEVLDSEGNAMKIPRGKLKGGDSDMAANDNADRVLAEERAKREKHRSEHEAQQKRNKEQQEREKLAKEKEKRRTAKKEKRRGCG